MGIVAFLIAAGRGDPDLYRLGGSPEGGQLGAGPVCGAVLGLVVVGLTRVATKRFQWARDLHASFRDLLGPLAAREIVILALASSIGEELLFRGALLPWLGVWWQAVAFALRSEERRVGKECRSGWWRCQERLKKSDRL